MKDWERKGMDKELARRVAPFVLQAKEERATERERVGEKGD